MLKTLERYAVLAWGPWPCVALACALLALPAAAEPIKLKLSFFSSDRSSNYLDAVKPFVDSVNVAADGLVEIEVYLSESLGLYSKQTQIVLDGTADLAFVNPSMTPDRFPDNTVMELPRLFRNASEGSLVYTRLVASGAIKGHEDFFVVAALGGAPQAIHVRAPITSLDDLKGKKIRAANRTEGALLKALGMVPQFIPINQAAAAISSGTIDGATGAPITLVEYGIARVASYHYFMRLGTAPLLILMNRKRFGSLPKAAQDVIRKFSGEWLAVRYFESVDPKTNRIIEQLKSDPNRKIIIPTQVEIAAIEAASKMVIEDWLAKSPRNRELLTAAETEISKLRSVP